MKKILAELKKVSNAIEKALKGMPEVTFTIDLNVHYQESHHPLIQTQVTLWLGHTFKKTVQGGDDIPWLAQQCRRTAEEYMKKIVDIAAMAKRGKKA